MTRPLSEISSIYHRPFFDLLDAARAVHRSHWTQPEVQLCTLLSIKTGGCSEDCGYCAQSARFKTGLKAERLLTTEEVLPHALEARKQGSTRFCMGAAWKGVRSGDARFNQVLDTIREVSKLGMEVCVTLGQLSDEEARQLREAGVTAYNHNIDTSPEHYDNIVSTHSFEDRLETIASVQRSGMALCCGGIMGMGETVDDRLRFLQVLTGFSPAPESIPINSLVPIPGTPLENAQPIDLLDLVRLIATTRILFPKAKVRLSAGRRELTREAQTLCFYAGANSIFYGDKLLTTANPEADSDQALLKALDLRPQEPFCDSRLSNAAA